MRLAVLLPIVYSLFATFLLAADPSSSAAIPDHVTAPAIIHEMNLARQNPALYATLLQQRRQNYSGGVCLLPGNIRLHTHEGVRALDDRYDFCIARSRNHHSRFRPVFVWLRLIIVASRLAVQRDITATMAAIPGIE